DIIAYLEDDCGIEAERRSIYKDIDDINKVALMLQNGYSIEEAEEELKAKEITQEYDDNVIDLDSFY
ncbi:MAG: hypothetical protein Q4E30_01750, partial [Streptococcus gallolyticus]|nr:hypothetical protein [Streptococcus gallolyticus]